MFINSRIANMMFRMRHGKGFLMLALVCYVETTTRTSAMSVWGRYQEWAQNRGAKGKNKTFNSKDNVRWSEDSCDLDDSSTVCSLSQSSERMYKRSRISKRVDGKENKNCPFDCSDCELLYSDSPYATKMVQKVSRGGEIKTQQVTAAGVVAETVSSQINPYGLHLNVWKIIFQACLTALNVFCWLAPLKNKKFSENKLGLSLANAFSGGVFLSLAFGHLLPECVHGFHGYNEALPFMIALGGYLLIFFVEKVAFDTQSLMESGEDNHTVDVKQNNGSSQNAEKSNPLGSGRSAVILLGALAVHSILEMTALGLADTFSDSALLSLSIALHQPAESIALLVAFLKSGLTETQIIKYLSIFSMMGPIGVALGMAVNEFAAPIVDAIMLATVAGTFIYVGATEVIPEEWEDSEHKWKKFFTLISGIVVVFGITQYTMTLEA